MPVWVTIHEYMLSSNTPYPGAPMTRIKIELPETYLFSTEIPVRITDLNYGNHLGNDAILSLLHEARVRFLAYYGWTESSVTWLAAC